MAGRFHFYEGHAPHEVVFPTFVMAALGVDTRTLRAEEPSDFLRTEAHLIRAEARRQA